MAIYKKTTGICYGRGFADESGILKLLKDWIVEPVLSGGPAWTIVDDQSALGTDPYIVVSDVNLTGNYVNQYDTGSLGGPPKIIRVGFITSEAGFIRTSFLGSWDTATKKGKYFGGGKIATTDAGDFVYDFRVGQETFFLGSRRGSDWGINVLTDFTGDTNLLEPASNMAVVSGYVSGSVLQLQPGFITNLVKDDWYYITDFSIANTGAALDNGAVHYKQLISSGTADGLPSDNHVEFGGGFEFEPTSGTVISPYLHRWLMYVGPDGDGGTSLSESGYPVIYREAALPYVSYYGGTDAANYDYCSWNNFNRDTGAGYSYHYCNLDYLESAITTMDPNDKGTYAAMKPLIVEYHNHYASLSSAQQLLYMNRAYGTPNNMYIAENGTFVQMTDGLIINGKNYLYMEGYGSEGLFILDTESDS